MVFHTYIIPLRGKKVKKKHRLSAFSPIRTSGGKVLVHFVKFYIYQVEKLTEYDIIV